ncbi:MAG: chemotaxis protein CheB [Bacteroidota bacterium]|nr:chemotaxis protein CheB [Bacteroidota bacterium]
MTFSNKKELIVVGGSAGSLSVLMQVIMHVSDEFILPMVIVIHRQRNVLSEFTKILSQACRHKRIVEPDDKDPIINSSIYVTPQNYHLLIEADRTFSLDYSEAIKFSRPSIDVTFESAARVFTNNLTAILLSGANNDGTAGLRMVAEKGGSVIAQAPESAEFAAMPQSAIESVAGIHVMNPMQIAEYINSVNSK